MFLFSFPKLSSPFLWCHSCVCCYSMQQQCLYLAFSSATMAVILAGDFWLLNWNGSSCNWNRDQKKNIGKRNYRRKMEPCNFGLSEPWWIWSTLLVPFFEREMGGLCMFHWCLFGCAKARKDLGAHGLKYTEQDIVSWRSRGLPCCLSRGRTGPVLRSSVSYPGTVCM